jgi:hypothetical protein
MLARYSALCGAALALLGCASEPGSESRESAFATSAQSDALRGHGDEHVSAELQQEISQVLWGCYAVGADLVGGGDVAGAKNVLRRCFADDFENETVTPPAYAELAFTTTGGADNWVDVSNGLYRGLGLARVQHLITNIVIHPDGPNAATVTSGALATHVYADEHTFNATVKFKDDFRRTNGTWMIKHRTMTVVSLTQSAAWAP